MYVTGMSRSEVMRVIEDTGKYSAVVIGVLNNPADAKSALMLIDDDIRKLEKDLQVAKSAAQYVRDAARDERTK